MADISPESVFHDAMQLSDHQRATLPALLIDSLESDIDSDNDAEAAWAEEIRRRLDDIDDGTVAPVPWPEARGQILSDDPPPG